MKRQKSKLSGDEFWLLDEGDEVTAMHESLPCLTMADVKMIAREQHRLSGEGVSFVFRRRKKGIAIDHAIWEFINFKTAGTGLGPAARECLSWVKQNIKKAVDPK